MSEQPIDAAVRQVAEALAGRAKGLLLRQPAIDPRCPGSSDLDFVVLADIDAMRAERLWLPGNPPADLTWLPWAWVADAAAAATHGWVPHRLLSSRVVMDAGHGIEALCARIAGHLHEPQVQAARIGVFLDTGWQTVREIGITWDFPELALFWLHMGHAACLSALADGLGLLCPNVYTRPFDTLDAVEARGHPGLRQRWTHTLRLQADVEAVAERLRRCQAQMARRFPEPAWPEAIGPALRHEYRYWLSEREVEFRIATARELARQGDAAAALFHLRFCAYTVARLPVVHARALEGWNVSFLRPEKAMRPELQRLAPELIDDLAWMLAGPGPLAPADLQAGLADLIDFRDRVIASLLAQGVPVPSLKNWAPYQPAVA